MESQRLTNKSESLCRFLNHTRLCLLARLIRSKQADLACAKTESQRLINKIAERTLTNLQPILDFARSETKHEAKSSLKAKFATL